MALTKKEKQILATNINSVICWSGGVEGAIKRNDSDEARFCMKIHNESARVINDMLGTDAVKFYRNHETSMPY
jgi:hypothetical protein